jgi:hypothetical protein
LTGRWQRKLERFLVCNQPFNWILPHGDFAWYSKWNTRRMGILERRRILAAKLKEARLKAESRRKLSRASGQQSQGVTAKRHQALTQAFVAKQLGISQSLAEKQLGHNI